MTGLVVDQSTCSEEFADDVSSMTTPSQQSIQHYALVLFKPNTFLYFFTFVDSSGSDVIGDSDAVIKCKVGVAAMVAFIAGFYQVTFKTFPELST